jgi:hypothetical protein
MGDSPMQLNGPWPAGRSWEAVTSGFAHLEFGCPWREPDVPQKRQGVSQTQSLLRSFEAGSDENREQPPPVIHPSRKVTALAFLGGLPFPTCFALQK